MLQGCSNLSTYPFYLSRKTYHKENKVSKSLLKCSEHRRKTLQKPITCNTDHECLLHYLDWCSDLTVRAKTTLFSLSPLFRSPSLVSVCCGQRFLHPPLSSLTVLSRVRIWWISDWLQVFSPILRHSLIVLLGAIAILNLALYKSLPPFHSFKTALAKISNDPCPTKKLQTTS